MPLAFVQAQRSIGFGTRVFANWAEINPERGKFVWDALDATIAAQREAGGFFYISSYFFPPWVTGGVNILGGYSTECSHNNVPFDFNVHSAIDDGKGMCAWRNEKTGERCPRTAPVACHNMPDLASNASYAWGRELRARYNCPLSSINEPGVETYYRGRENEEGREKFRRLCDQHIAPFTGGARSVGPTTFIGPEADSPGLLRDILAYEEIARHKFNARWFDVIAFHGYADDRDPDPVVAALRRYNEDFRPIIDEYGNGREVWDTENGFKPNEPGYEERTKRYLLGAAMNGISAVNLHDPFQLFVKGSVKHDRGWKHDDGQLEDGHTTYELSDLGHYLKSLRSGGKRRGVQS
jgi:hypothetical protein